MSTRSTLFAAACLLGGAAWWQHPQPGETPAAGIPPHSTTVSAAVDASEPMPAPGVSVRPLAASPRSAKTPAEVREVLRFTRSATLADRAALREAALCAEDALVAGSAALALGRLRVFASDEDLLRLTADPRPRVRQDAVIACGLDGRPEAIAHLERALAGGDASLRLLALDALGRIGGPLAREVIRGVSSDPAAAECDRVFARAAEARLEHRGAP